MLTYTIHAATFDLQNPSAIEENNSITVSGEFITNSRARGCFIAIESDSYADRFVAIQRKESEQVLTETIPVPPSSYIVYAYDLEQNTLPHHIPADSPADYITINTECKSSIYIILVFTQIIDLI